jgi:hypothetical protein
LLDETGHCQMRDLHAELEKWNEDALTEWDPGAGDILVGVVESQSQGDACGIDSITVKEEETGTPILVKIDSPQLACLLTLQRPNVGERIGLKYNGKKNETGEKRYVLMVDREHIPDVTEASECTASVSDECVDDFVGATAEERLFIEQSLEDQSAAFETCMVDEVPVSSDLTLREIIRRQDEEILRQSGNIERLETMLASAIPLISNKVVPTNTETPLQVTADQTSDVDNSQGVPDTGRRMPGWARFCLTTIALAASCGLGVAAHILLHIR